MKWFYDLKIKNKLLFIALIAIASLVLLGVFFNYLLNTSRVLSLEARSKEYLHTEYQFAVENYYRYIISKDSLFLKKSLEHIDHSITVLDFFIQLEDANQSKSTEALVKEATPIFIPFMKSTQNVRLYLRRVRVLLKYQSDEYKKIYTLARDLNRNILEIRSIISNTQLNDIESRLAMFSHALAVQSWIYKDYDETIEKLHQAGRRVFQYGLFFSILLFGVLTYIITRLITISFTRSIDDLVSISKKFAANDLSVELVPFSQDEVGQLVMAFQQVKNNLEDIVRQTQNVVKGDYSSQLVSKSENDELSAALNEMTRSLAEKDTVAKDQDWLKSGLNELSEKITGEQDTIDLCQNAMNFIARYIDAHVGTIYIKDDNDELRLVASYAFTKRKSFANVFKLGEGIIGQCALERKPFLISNIPEDYIKINSGLGETQPVTLTVTPLLADNTVTGVIEFGAFYEFSDMQMQFLENISSMLAIAIRTTESRKKMHELLEKTQLQAEEMDKQQEKLRLANQELQTQQKDIRVKNQELEKQALILKDSEAELQAQQEELRQTNEELEEKTESLERYAAEIHKKNEDLKSAQLLLEERAEKLEHASQYKSDFLANMSHELRTPLNSLLILAKMLAENKDGNLTEKQVTFASTIHSSGSELLELINDILDLSKIEAGKMEVNIDEFDLQFLPQYIKRNFEHIAKEKNVYLKTNVSEELPAFISSDRQKVEQIVKNLLSNAFKFTNEGGVTIDIQKVEQGVKLYNENLEPDETVCIAISDTGIGIPPKKQELIFAAFQQADSTISRKHGGTGLGLSISKELTRLLGGELQVASIENKGSTFTLYLPFHFAVASLPDAEKKVVEKETAAPRDDAAKAVRPPDVIKDDRDNLNKGDKAILIIENDIRFTNILMNIAKNKDFKCLVAYDGDAGLGLAKKYSPGAIILEVDLPKLNGWQVFEKLQADEDTRDIPVYFISGEDQTEQALERGAFGLLRKPADLEDVKRVFATVESKQKNQIKKLLLVSNNKDEREDILQYIERDDVESATADNGEQALELLANEKYDCLIVDLTSQSESAQDFIKQLKDNDTIEKIPIIVYVDEESARQSAADLQNDVDSIIVKSSKYMERLLDETTLLLHRIESGLSQAAVSMTHDKEAIFKDKKILIVDDDMRNVFALSSILEEKKAHIVVGKNGIEGLQRLEEHNDVDMVLMDIMMPEMDGYEAMTKIREQKKFKDLPIIALTAKAMKGDREKCINAGANDYMPKPVEADKLLSLLRVWLYKK